MPLYLNTSQARRSFKQLLGNGNQLLITILIGLNAVERQLVTDAPPELHAAWDPRDPKASAGRSRVMTLGMALVRATDALDAYISVARRKPSLIQDTELKNQIDACDRSVLRKFFLLKDAYLSSDRVIAALMEVMIVWRNLMVHSLSDNKVTEESWSVLRANADWIKNEFKGMEVERLFSDFEEDGPPTFKETASFIRATHKVVEIIDGLLIHNLDQKSFLRELIWTRAGIGIRGKDETQSRHQHLQNIWGRDPADRGIRVLGFLRNCGLSESSSHEYTPAVFDDEVIAEVTNKTPSEMTAWLAEEPLDNFST